MILSTGFAVYRLNKCSGLLLDTISRIFQAATVVVYIEKWKQTVGRWLTITNTRLKSTNECEMTSIDDTFRKLAQRPFEEVRLMVRDMHIRKMPGHKIRTALKNRGWTVDEYTKSHVAALKHECDIAFDKAFSEIDAHIESTK